MYISYVTRNVIIMKENQIKELSIDYQNAHTAANTLNINEQKTFECDEHKRFRKYIYEIGLKCLPRRRFRTKFVDDSHINITRII